ncbi:hypothetical protein C8R45DRAFT_1025613 [Mycena sanguinolenta]|nr:hypothetical protein C8R45DRAFT_1025613 [Mycena sanguinolenta]
MMAVDMFFRHKKKLDTRPPLYLHIYVHIVFAMYVPFHFHSSHISPCSPLQSSIFPCTPESRLSCHAMAEDVCLLSARQGRASRKRSLRPSYHHGAIPKILYATSAFYASCRACDSNLRQPVTRRRCLAPRSTARNTRRVFSSVEFCAQCKGKCRGIDQSAEERRKKTAGE